MVSRWLVVMILTATIYGAPSLATASKKRIDKESTTRKTYSGSGATKMARSSTIKSKSAKSKSKGSQSTEHLVNSLKRQQSKSVEHKNLDHKIQGSRINPSSEPPLSQAESEKLIHALREKNLGLPIAGFDPQKMKGSFYQTHGGVQHGAADLLAPRNTPVLAVQDGTIDKLFLSKAGGITIYQSDPSRRFIYYYAHLEKYAPGLHNGQAVHKGEIIGYVGTSGNAPKNTPHLHFSVGLAQAPSKWWVTSSVDPYEVYK